MSRKPAAVVAGAADQQHDPSVPRITKKLPRESGFAKTAKERKLAGVYRVIHSNVVLPRPENEWKDEHGKRLPGESSLEVAQPGDEVYLGDEDALRLLADDIVEELDSKPSRVPRYDEQGNVVRGTGVFTPPKVSHNMNAGPNESPKYVQPTPHGSRI
jgi:hypothetical protein